MNEFDKRMTEQENREQRKVDALEKIWEFMAQMYGDLWVNAYGESAAENIAWKAGISGLTGKQIKAGLEKVALSGKTFPPTLPEFLAYCKDSKYDFKTIFGTCVHWKSDDELKIYGYERTREVLFIMQHIGSEFFSASKNQAEKLVRGAIEKLEQHVANGGELPDFPKAEIAWVPLPKMGVSFAEIMKQAGVA